MSLKKPSEFFCREVQSPTLVENYSAINFPTSQDEKSKGLYEVLDKFKNNIHKIEEFSTYEDKVSELSLRVKNLTEELSSKLNTSDLEKAMLSHLMILDENFKSIRNEIKGINKKDLKDFKNAVSNLEELVSHSITSELPRHKKLITDNEFKILNKFEHFSSNVEDELEIVDEKIERFSQVVDKQLTDFNEEILNTKNEVLNITETYKKLHKIIENKTLKENEKLEQYQKILNEFNKKITDFEHQVTVAFDEYRTTFSGEIIQQFQKFSFNINEKYDVLNENVDLQISTIKKDFADVKSDVLINEQHIKNFSKEIEVIENYIQEYRKDIVELKEEVYSEIDKLPVGNLQENIERIERKIDFIRETYSRIEPETIVKEVISEGLLNEPPEVKNQDPLTPLNQNFVTLDQLQQHYRLFINRIQQQLSTLGGGGETQLKYLDDIVGIATNASAYDGKYLKYNDALGKFEFSDVTSGISGITIQSAGNPLGTATTINFDTNLTATFSSGIATITGGSSLSISTVTSSATNYVTFVSSASTTSIGITQTNLTFVPSTGNLSAVQFTSLSDRTQKKNITKIDNALEIVNQLEGVRFEWIDNNKSSMGLIAQDTEQVLPEVVETNEDGIKSVSYGNIIGVLIEAIKEQQIRIEELERKLNA